MIGHGDADVETVAASLEGGERFGDTLMDPDGSVAELSCGQEVGAAE